MLVSAYGVLLSRWRLGGIFHKKGLRLKRKKTKKTGKWQMATRNSEKKRQVTIDSCSQTLQIYKGHTMTHYDGQEKSGLQGETVLYTQETVINKCRHSSK